ncbi:MULTISPECIES: peptidase [Thioclava]|uniref:Peptidase n=1 Tax=Thioclava litoralis TaxID=3076557 RepID=A0ABZ1DY13_9RHOB|nr:peptidase [Thioclava sp. FTW29]
MTARSEVVFLARAWIGTPYSHQASCLQGGTDCLGLIRGIWRSLYGCEPELPAPYSADWAEAGGAEALWQAAARHLVPVQANDPFRMGQVLLFRMKPRAVAKHVGLLSERGPLRFIHAYGGHGVVENALSAPWRARLVARFDFPDVR